ncbi:hypothetical protein IID21_00875 [Patescibacteria group bacterium]|nr:hypothetical protein [Patescibacteria group bacterium]
MAAKAKSNKLIYTLVALAVFILAAGYLAGTSYRKTRKEEVETPKVVVPAEELPENVSRGSIQEASGGFEIERGGLRAFPRDFPVYPGALVASSWKVRSEPPFEGETVVWEAEASISDVANFYKDEMEDAGWSATELAVNQTPAMLGFDKAQTKVYFWIGPEAGSTVVQVTIATK